MPNAGTPETTEYMILGYALTVLILGALIVYLVVKSRQLRAEVDMLASLEEDQPKEKRKNDEI